MRKTARDLVMRSPEHKGDWFRIENKQNADGEDVAEIYIYDEIGYWGTDAAGFIRQLKNVTADKIKLHINSPGGEVFDGVAIYTALKAHPADVEVIVDSLAASAASFIAQAGDTVLMTRNATMMIHDASAVVYGNAKDMHDMANLLDKLSNNVADMYAQRAGGTVDEWRALMQEEVWYNAEEAVSAGLADKVLDYSDTEAEKAKNKWNLGLFNHSSRDEAPDPSEIKKLTISNRAKEAPVGKPTPPKMTEPGGQPPAEGAPVEEPPVEGAPVEEPPVEEAPVEEAPVEEPPAGDPENKGPKPIVNKTTGAITFMLDGKATTDPAAVQAHINTLEQANQENKDAGRKAFVQNLVVSKKISASQQTELEEFAVELTDKQWDKWKASYEKAPSMSLLESHGTIGNGPQHVTDEKKKEDRIEVLEAILTRHRQAGMSEAALQKTPSYMELQQLKSTS